MSTTSIYHTAAGGEAIVAYYNTLLERWPVPHTRLTVPTCHGDTFVIASGATGAPPLVLLHGTGSNSATWMGDVIEYAKHFRVYAVDMPGEPGNSAPPRFPWDGPAFNEWLGDVLDGLQVDNVALGGMSLGAWAAVNYAVQYTERVERLILIVPSGICQPRLGFILRVIVWSMLGGWGREQLKRYIFNGADFPPAVEEFLDLVNLHFRYRTGSPPLFTDEQLHRLTMPVILLAGDNDVMLDTPKTAARLEQILPQLTVRRSTGDGHATINTATEVMAWITTVR